MWWTSWQSRIKIKGQCLTVPNNLIVVRFKSHRMTMLTNYPFITSHYRYVLASCFRPYLNMTLLIPLNRLRVFGSKFFTIATGLSRISSIASFLLRIIDIFILHSAMIVLTSFISLVSGFVIQRIALSIWLLVALLACLWRLIAVSEVESCNFVRIHLNSYM